MFIGEFSPDMEISMFRFICKKKKRKKKKNLNYFFFFYKRAFILVGAGFILCLMNLIGIILRISAKDQYETVSIIFGSTLIVLIAIMNTLQIIYFEKWDPSKIPISYFNGGISLFLLVVFSIGSTFLFLRFKNFSRLKTESGSLRRYKYLRLGLSFFTLGTSTLFSVFVWFFAANNVDGTKTSISFVVISFAVTGTLLASLSSALMFVPSRKSIPSFLKSSVNSSNSINPHSKL